MSDVRLRILVADDEEGVLFALKEYLGRCGWEVSGRTTKSGAAGTPHPEAKSPPPQS